MTNGWTISFLGDAPRLELAVHDVSIYVSVNWMAKSFRKPPNDIEIETLPKAHGPFIDANHEIELHCLESAGFGVVE